MRKVFGVVALILTAAFVTSCHEFDWRGTLRSYYIDSDCELRVDVGGVTDRALKVDADGKPAFIGVYQGEKVMWCNRTEHWVTFVVDDAKVLGGRRSIRIAPGECVTLRVATARAEWKLKWTCWSRGDDGTIVEDGGGASPGKTENPPPPPPSGP